MAKRKSNKKAGKEVSKKTRAKGAAKSAAKKSTPHKPVDDKDKVTIEIPSDIEHPLEQTDITQTDNPVDVRKSDAEILTDGVEDPQKEDQAGGVTEAIIEAAAETERLAEEAESLQTKDDQTGIVVEVKDSVAAENLSLDTEDTEANKPMGDISESVVEGAITTESTTEKKDDFPSGKQAENSTVADVESSDTEIHAGKVEAPQTEGQTEEITEAILEAAAETERLAEEADSLQTEDEQTGIVVEVEDPDAAESLSQDTVDTETDKSVDDVSESFVEDSVTDENLTEKIDDTRTDGQPEDVKETSVEDPDTIESCIEKADDIQTGSQSDEAILEVAAETERLVEDVESLQTDDKQTGLIVETEDSDAAESPSQDTEDAKADKSVDDVSESVVEDSVTVENTTEKIDDTKTDGQPEDVNETSIDDPDTIEDRIEKADDTQTDNQAGEVIDADADVEETVIGDSAAENQTVVDRIKKFFSGIFRIDSKVDDSTQEGIESQVEAEGFTEGTDGIHADKQVDADEDIESPETVATHTGKADDIRTDNQEVSAAGDNF